jgi:hypothetical protein
MRITAAFPHKLVTGQRRRRLPFVAQRAEKEVVSRVLSQVNRETRSAG